MASTVETFFLASPHPHQPLGLKVHCPSVVSILLFCLSSVRDMTFVSVISTIFFVNRPPCFSPPSKTWNLSLLNPIHTLE